MDDIVFWIFEKLVLWVFVPMLIIGVIMLPVTVIYECVHRSDKPAVEHRCDDCPKKQE